jgi:leucyl aminopeptidase (aminopeptidase T)
MTGLESVITERELECYPKLVVSLGANVAPGQLVLGGGLVAHAPFARALACAAYRGGARHVDVHYEDRHLARALVESGPDELVRGLELRFEGGRCVGVSAESGADLVREEMAADEQASCLGEVALVDGTSRVGQTGLTFFDTLFDENATCHIA